MNQKKQVIRIENLSKTFDVKDQGRATIRDSILHFWKKNNNRKVIALENVSFEVYKGEIFGIIGRNGSGKSTLLNCIIGVMQGDNKDSVNTKGKILRLAMGMGFDPNLTARENIYINGSILGLSFKLIGELFDEIIDFAGLHEFIDVPIKTYSQGMQTRLKFSIAIHAEADIFLLDEFFGGTGDVEFQKKSTQIFKTKFLENTTVVLVSHNMRTIRTHCDRVMWIENGKLKEIGSVDSIVDLYLASI